MPTDQEMIVIEKIVCYSQFLREVACHIMVGGGGAHEKILSLVTCREKGAVGKRPYGGICRKEEMRQGQQA